MEASLDMADRQRYSPSSLLLCGFSLRQRRSRSHSCKLETQCTSLVHLSHSLSPLSLSLSLSLSHHHRFMPECNFFRVLHSMHASYSELCDFISYLKPRRIVPCVVPVGDSSLSDVNTRLDRKRERERESESKGNCV